MRSIGCCLGHLRSRVVGGGVLLLRCLLQAVENIRHGARLSRNGPLQNVTPNFSFGKCETIRNASALSRGSLTCELMADVLVIFIDIIFVLTLREFFRLFLIPKEVLGGNLLFGFEIVLNANISNSNDGVGESQLNDFVLVWASLTRELTVMFDIFIIKVE